MKIGGTIAFWVKVGLIVGIVAVVLYLYNKIRGILPTGETLSNALARVKETASAIFPPSVSLDTLSTEQKKAVTEIARWRSLPVVGTVAGWIAERYYSTRLPYETLPTGSSMDVGVSMPASYQENTVISEPEIDTNYLIQTQSD